MHLTCRFVFFSALVSVLVIIENESACRGSSCESFSPWLTSSHLHSDHLGVFSLRRGWHEMPKHVHSPSGITSVCIYSKLKTWKRAAPAHRKFVPNEQTKGWLQPWSMLMILIVTLIQYHMKVQYIQTSTWTKSEWTDFLFCLLLMHLSQWKCVWCEIIQTQNALLQSDIYMCSQIEMFLQLDVSQEKWPVSGLTQGHCFHLKLWHNWRPFSEVPGLTDGYSVYTELTLQNLLETLRSVIVPEVLKMSNATWNFLMYRAMQRSRFWYSVKWNKL